MHALPCPVLVLTTFDFDEHVLAALKAAANGFLRNDTPPEDLLSGIRTVAEGEALLSPSDNEQPIREYVNRPDSPPIRPPEPDGLTDRELKVLALVARGWSKVEVAERLFISCATTKSHISRLLKKLAAGDRAQLIVMAYEVGLVSPRT